MPDTVLGYIEWNFDPVIFEFNIFGHKFPVAWYGALFALAFVGGQMVLSYMFKKDGKSKADMESLTINVVLCSVIGARLGHYLFYEWEYLVTEPMKWLTNMITPPFAGLASHGGTIGVFLAVYLYSRKRPDQPFLWVIDRVAILASFAGFIRIGNFLNSEIYGIPTDLPWGVKFMAETNPGLLPIVPRHPTQIYEFLVCVLLFIITFWMWQKKRHILSNGIIFCTFTILLFTFRFFIEFLKNDQSMFEANLPFNMGQILSIPMVVCAAVLLIYLQLRSKPSVSNVPPPTSENA